MITSCKEEKTECPVIINPEPFETMAYEFQLQDKGYQSIGHCGPVILAYLDSTKSTLTYFKAIDLPKGISFSLNTYYTGKFRVLPEKYKCTDGTGDPFSGQSFPTIYPNFVNILSWKVK